MDYILSLALHILNKFILKSLSDSSITSCLCNVDAVYLDSVYFFYGGWFPLVL